MFKREISKFKIVYIVGARPNFIKIAPLIAEAKKYKAINSILVHTDQHYDFAMSEVFFQDLEIPKPKYNLNVNSDSAVSQIAEIMKKLEPIFLSEKPDLVVVVGDVNSTLGGALTSVKLGIPVAHVEAGLRSFDRNMPEEVNRILVDSISDYLFVTEPSGVNNLIREGISESKIFLVGNVMIDALKNSKFKIQKSKVLEKLNLRKKEYAVLTLHRPSNVENKKVFEGLLDGIFEIQKKIKVIYPLHPRAKKQIAKFKLEKIIEETKNLILVPSLSYLDMMKLVKESKFLMTDSGGLQEESTVLGIPCLTLRENTERPITLEKGTNTLCGTKKEVIIKQAEKILEGKEKKGRIPQFWDGKTSQRIIRILLYRKLNKKFRVVSRKPRSGTVSRSFA